MFKSLFSKYFTVMSLIVVVSFLALGGMLSFFSIRYWKSEKQEILYKNAVNIAQFAASNAAENPVGSNQYQLDASLMPFLDLLASAIDSQALVADTDGRVVVCSEGTHCRHIGKSVGEEALEKIRGTGSYYAVGAFRELFGNPQFVVGVPMRRGDLTLGYVFMATSSDATMAYVRDNLQVFFLSALGILALTFIVTYILTYRMVRPLRQMADAARRFGAGDFTSRVPVTSRDEVAERATALNAMVTPPAAAEGMRRSFIASVSHELRTPMTTIAGFIDGILDGTIPPEKHTYYLNIVSGEIKRLSRLIKSMLALSRIDNGELRLNPSTFDLVDMAGNVLLSFEQRIERKRLTISGLEDSPPAEVTADFDLLGQVVYNLIDNAVKFTEEGGEISLFIRREKEKTTFTIQNTGAGIPANEMPHIFERFYKSDFSRSLDKTGMGLGLYIVKSIISAHNGEITVRSVEHEYCAFTFWLPNPPQSRLS